VLFYTDFNRHYEL
jgi:hypothetical protein